MHVLRTTKDFPHSIQILGVGVLEPRSGSVIVVEDAAKTMSELMRKQKDANQLDLDSNGNPQPLEGKALYAAAREWADGRDGVELVEINQAEKEELQASGAMLVDHTPEDTLAAAIAYGGGEVEPPPVPEFVSSEAVAGDEEKGGGA